LSAVVPLLLLFFLLGLFPVNFHLHYHRRGKTGYFLLDLRLFRFSLWRYRSPAGKREGIGPNRQAQGEPRAGRESGEEESGERRSGIAPFLIDLAKLGSAFQKYGLGGTFFSFLLPEDYRKWVTVTEKLERKGAFQRFVWRTVIGGPEPALLGPAVGLAWNVKGVILGFLTNEYLFKKPPFLLVVPCFSEAGWETMLDCIFEIKLGHIIVAGIKDYLSQLVGGKKNAGTPD